MDSGKKAGIYFSVSKKIQDAASANREQWPKVKKALSEIDTQDKFKETISRFRVYIDNPKAYFPGNKEEVRLLHQ